MVEIRPSTSAETRPSTSVDHVPNRSRTRSSGEDSVFSREQHGGFSESKSKSKKYRNASNTDLEDSVFGSYVEVEFNSFFQSVMTKFSDKIVEVDED